MKRTVGTSLEDRVFFTMLAIFALAMMSMFWCLKLIFT